MSRMNRRSEAEEKATYQRRYEKLKEEGHSFWPWTIFEDIVAAAVMLVVLILLAVFAGVSSEKLADPTNTSYNPRPDWYFMALFQLLKLFPGALEWVGVVMVPAIVVLILIALPFNDRGPERRPSKRPLAMAAMVIGLALFILLTVQGFSSTPVAKEETGFEGLNTIQQQGLSLFKANGCDSCHSIDSKGGVIGPPMDGVGSRYDDAYLHNYIENPSAYNPGSMMPSFLGPLGHTEVDAIVQYLLTLK